MLVTNTAMMWAALRHRMKVSIESSGRMFFGTFSAIELEDGSGLSYNITIRDLKTGIMETVWVRFQE